MHIGFELCRQNPFARRSRDPHHIVQRANLGRRFCIVLCGRRRRRRDRCRFCTTSLPACGFMAVKIAGSDF